MLRHHFTLVTKCVTLDLAWLGPQAEEEWIVTIDDVTFLPFFTLEYSISHFQMQTTALGVYLALYAVTTCVTMQVSWLAWMLSNGLFVKLFWPLILGPTDRWCYFLYPLWPSNIYLPFGTNWTKIPVIRQYLTSESHFHNKWLWIKQENDFLPWIHPIFTGAANLCYEGGLSLHREPWSRSLYLDRANEAQQRQQLLSNCAWPLQKTLGIEWKFPATL